MEESERKIRDERAVKLSAICSYLMMVGIAAHSETMPDAVQRFRNLQRSMEDKIRRDWDKLRGEFHGPLAELFDEVDLEKLSSGGGL